ncbi:hypothetical protein BJ508DRAFT_216035 [Ascobolus immersus RN42]|uniref:non-specific serine/threonine protein kinase n=1 Tax=Ascobolus immersus RN42 TaxID=1160509 RepID=A0A3N4HI20_ASCIM|nr:hypothetical protein BJ508DRAFT_216035 [Ascobolus immersus RN42]
MATLELLSNLEEFRSVPEACIWGLFALGRILSHSAQAKHLDLTTSLGRWVVYSLQSSVREQRLAAARTLPAYLQQNIEKGVLERNQRIVVSNLRALGERKEPHLLEATLVAWGELARVSKGEQLSLALLQMVEYLGSDYTVVYYMAQAELKSLERNFGKSLQEITAPFLQVLSVRIVLRAIARPQILESFCTLTGGGDVNAFLRSTAKLTLPYLVLSSRTDVIHRIARACDKDVGELLSDGNVLPWILTRLLMVDCEDVEQNARRLLGGVSQELAALSWGGMCRGHTTVVGRELLREFNPAEVGGKNDRIVRALELVAAYTVKEDERDGPVLECYIKQYVLAFVTTYSDVLRDVENSTPKPVEEKLKALRAIWFMVRIGGAAVVPALPQICLCVQSCFANRELQATAVRTWKTLMEKVPEGEIEQMQLCGLTFALLLQYWAEFDEGVRAEAREMVAGLFASYAELLERNVAVTPALEGIAELARYEGILKGWRDRLTIQELLGGFVVKVGSDNGVVVQQALVELARELRRQREWVLGTGLSEQPDPILAELLSCLLASCARFQHDSSEIQPLLAQCLGLIGAVDPDRVQLRNAEPEYFLLNNFADADECADFIVHFLDKILVKAFLSTPNTNMQGRIAFVCQDLMKFLGWNETVHPGHRIEKSHKWNSLSQLSRNTLVPFLHSLYIFARQTKPAKYPIFSQDRPHQSYRFWLAKFLWDLLGRAKGENAEAIFEIAAAAVAREWVAAGEWLLPYVVLNIVIGGEEAAVRDVQAELLGVLRYEGGMTKEVRLRCEAIFGLVDHLSRWVEKRRTANYSVLQRKARMANRHLGEGEETGDAAIARVEAFLGVFPVDLMGLRSLECGAYPRALFYWERHIRAVRDERTAEEMEGLYQRLQGIYRHIDEPDGIEGLGCMLGVGDVGQMVVEWRVWWWWASRYSWLVLRDEREGDEGGSDWKLLGCLKEGGQYEALVRQVDGLLDKDREQGKRFLNFGIEAAWQAQKWDGLGKYLEVAKEKKPDYDVALGQALLAIRAGEEEVVNKEIETARQLLVEKLTPSATMSLRACRDVLVKMHALSEVADITAFQRKGEEERREFTEALQKRLDMLGSSAQGDKQYLLSLRRTVFSLSADLEKDEGAREHLAQLYITSSKLARKAGNIRLSFDHVMHASALGSILAPVEHARLLWHEGQHRKAIHLLRNAIDTHLTPATITTSPTQSRTLRRSSTTTKEKAEQNIPLAKAKLLLAKWLDAAGQSHSAEIVKVYQAASGAYLRWEQGHYYLGRHYNKLFEIEKNLPVEKQAQTFLNGEMAKLVVQSYLRAICFGNKYIWVSMPRMLTLWLDLGEASSRGGLDERGGSDEFRGHVNRERVATLNMIHASVKKYMPRIPAYLFYTAFPQILSRITHPHEKVWEQLMSIIVYVVKEYPKVTLWSLMAVCKSTQKDRSKRGKLVLDKLKEASGRTKAEKAENLETRLLVSQAQKVTEQLLHLSNYEITGKPATVSISRDLRFNRSVAPCGLVIPNQAHLTVIIPADPVHRRNHSPFPAQLPTIQEFLDEADVMSSLQKPRKITIRGSDGHLYPLLCKPKDDLRKDARLMEFNTMINRLLKRDPEASRRTLKIRTYCVTPLNEECGLIEWVNGMRPLREILMRLYKQKNIGVNYGEIRALLDDASSDPSRYHVFSDRLLPMFPPVFHEWFIERFPEPGQWFASRLAYSRTCAVMSIVGYVLGLGDRHGENILFDEVTGDTLHVDFNCLFDKGLTFDKPERVPFRLTHNMVDALGVTGYEGPFRRSCEVSMVVLRENEESLMTIMETFLHDPAVDMVKRTRKHSVVPDTPREVLEEIRKKLRGLMGAEAVPLSVEGQVQELVQEAVSEANLSRMYIGWMSFF